MKSLFILAAVAALLCSGCATSFKQYEGGDIQQGSGGTKETIKGIDIWDNGTPPRKYRVIGVVDDIRRDAVLVPSSKGAMVRKAMEAGGDAVIMAGSERQYVGSTDSGESGHFSGSSLTTGQTRYDSFGSTYHTSGSGNYTSYGSTSSAIYNQSSRALVIKYVD